MGAPAKKFKSPQVSEGVSFSDREVRDMLANVDKYTDAEVDEILNIVEEIERRKHIEACQIDLIEFCKYMQEDYIVGKHHRILADLLMDIAHGERDRISVSIAPRHGKSQIVSIFFTAWYLGHFPNHKLMLVSCTTDLAVDFGRKVRNLIMSAPYQEIFPNTSIAKDSKSAGRWNTATGGEFYAAGVGSAIAGRGAHLLVIDDPHSEQDILNGNFETFDRAYEWFTFGARTRLMPGGRVALVACLTGDTRVLMAGGSEKELRDVRSGDRVATYENGEITTSRVTNWINHGLDNVCTIRLNSGNLIKGNQRHPFLVDTGEERKWIRLKNLKPGMKIVSTLRVADHRTTQQNGDCVKFATTTSGDIRKKQAGCRHHWNIKNTPAPQTAAIDLEKQKLNPQRVTLAGAARRTTARTQTLRTVGLTIGGKTKVKHAQLTNAQNHQTRAACAWNTTTRSNGLMVKGEELLKKIERLRLNIDMGSRLKTMIACTLNRVVDALSVILWKAKYSQNAINLSLTTATIPIECVPFYATNVTFSSNPTTQKKCYSKPLSTYGLTLDTIISIEPCGQEEVFDIEVERTENFIANGLVSHNTRWHADDLIGRVIKDGAKDEKADQYEVVEFPAILETTDEITGKTTEKALWPEFFDLEALHRTKASMPNFQWNAQYQQNPTGEEGALIKRDWWGAWLKDDPPECSYVIMTLDAAQETHNRADYTAITTWGIFFNEEENLNHIILLNAVKERYEFPELKTKALQEYNQWKPDSFIVEKKSAGAALYQEMRRMGISVSEYTPHRGSGDKTARLNSVTDIVKSGVCWVPRTRWAEELVDEVASFPFGSNDDLVDTTVMALMRFRQGGFLRLPSDEQDEQQYWKKPAKGYY